MPDLTILSSIRGCSLGIGMPGGELLLLYWVAHLWWGGQGTVLSILVLLWSGVEHSGVARSTLPDSREPGSGGEGRSMLG